MSPTSSDSLSERLPLALALVSLGFVAVLVLHLAGRPIYTDDAWFHLAMGAVYATEGLWPAADPLLHTAHAHAPVQHEWLFGVAVYAIESAVGFHGLRLVHVLAVVATLWLAFSILRRETRWTVAACLGTSLFCVLAWGRLFQLRPDLVSIPAALATYRLLLAGEDVPSWGRVAATCLLFLVWANLHSLFALGPALLIAALLGCALRALLRVWLVFRAGPSSESPPTRDNTRFARRIGVALGLGLLATLLNP